MPAHLSFFFSLVLSLSQRWPNKLLNAFLRLPLTRPWSMEKGNSWCPSIRNLWVLSAFITAIASRQNKERPNCLGSLSSLWLPRGFNGTVVTCTTHTHICTCIHTQNKVCGWLLWCAAGIRMSCGQPCATEWPQDTQSSTALYLKCTCMIYLGPWKAGKESLRHPAILSGPE